MLNPTTVIHDYVLQKMGEESVAKRIELARALAALTPTSEERIRLLDLAKGLEDLERQYEELRFEFNGGRS